jgi:hypothetical protein
VKTNAYKTAGLALALAMTLAPSLARSVEIYNNGKDAKVDFGARFQVQGVFENLPTTDYVPSPGATDGRGGRDFTRIFLFQPENRLKLDAELDGVILKFENAMGSESYAGSNNVYDLLELSGEFPVQGGLSVVAGLSKMPDNNASATYEEDMLFTSHSQLLNWFFNKGYDTAVFAKYHAGLFDAILGTEQGVPNLPQRYIPERLEMPVPVFLRVGVGNIKDDPARFKQIGFEKSDSTQWAAHLNGFWVGDSNAGHGTLFSQMSGQADAPKGPFVNGNEIFSKNYNPFLAAGASAMGGSLGTVNNQFWQASFDAQLRQPLGDKWLIFGAQYSIAQFVAPNTTPLYLHNTAPINSATATPNGGSVNFGQITDQGVEAYVGLDTDKWFAATRLDVLIPDTQTGVFTATVGTGGKVFQPNVGNFKPIFQNASPVFELAFPSLGWKFSKYAKLVAELEHDFNIPIGVDTDGVYDLKTVPVEASLNNFDVLAYSMTGRLMFQVAF